MDEFDIQLLHTLQIAPRISWARAGEVLGLSPNAVAPAGTGCTARVSRGR